MVQVNVSVQDKDGNSVGGLKKEDFDLFDQGELQEITFFSEEAEHQLAPKLSSDPHFFSNRFERVNAAPHLVVVVLDIHMSAYFDYVVCKRGPTAPECGAVARTFQAGQKFLSTLEPQDRIALYEYADKLHLLRDFTSDKDELLRALGSGKKYIGDMHFAATQMRPLDIAFQTTAAMRFLAERLARLPGRKTVIWLSIGFPSRPPLNDEDIQRAVRSLNNADAPLNAVDATGLAGPESWPNFGHVRLPGGGGGPVAGGGGVKGRAPPTAAESADSFGSLANIALDSGGQVFQNTNDLAGAMRRALNDSHGTYVLGYYPAHGKWDGQYRSIKVRVKQAGIQVNARKGYYASLDSAPPTPATNSDTADAIQNPLDSLGLRFDALVDPLSPYADRKLKTTLTFDASQFHFVRNGDRWSDDVAVLWVRVDTAGLRQVFRSQTLNLRPDETAFRELLQNGFSFTETMEIPVSTAELRIIIRDAGSGNIGSVSIPLSRLFTSRDQE